MFRNYLQIAFRNLFRHKLFSTVNIFCLSIGITFAMIIGVYVLQQERVNAGLKDVGNQYFIKSNWKDKGMGEDITAIGPLAKTMREEYPALVANYYRFNPVTNVVSAGDRHFKEDVAICDTTLISMYGFPLLYGNKDNAFPHPGSALITETLAMKLFGRKDVLGKTISMETLKGQPQDYAVSGVLKDPPYNTVTGMATEVRNEFGMFVPIEGNKYYPGGDGSDSWTDWDEVSLLELNRDVTPGQLRPAFEQVLKKYTSAYVQANLKVELSSIRNYYLRDNENNGANGRMIAGLSLVAFFILLMAIINFVNINIGTSSYRIKEIGLRKVFGGERAQLIAQFMMESFVLSVLAGIISLAFYELLRPLFDKVLQLQLDPLTQFGWRNSLFFILLVLAIGLVSGIYPALILSGSKIIHAVKGKPEPARGSLLLRKGLLVVQFTLAVVLFIGAVTVSRQVSYAFKKDLGYNKDQLMVITPFPKEWDSAGVAKVGIIMQGLRQLPEVRDISLSSELPEGVPNPLNMIPEGSKSDQPRLIPSFITDEHFASTFGLHMLVGTFFNLDRGAYIPNQLVLNESAVRAFGWKSSIGKNVRGQLGGKPFTVVGIVRDFNYANLHESIGPVAFFNIMDFPQYRVLAVRLNTPDIAKAIADIRVKWKALAPNAPFEYAFMDDRFRKIYSLELQLRNAACIATALNLVIIFMGIFGVVAFTLVRRSKEMAIRKVLGADVGHIILLFIRDYAWLILIANLIGWPLAYMLTGKWLQSYAYKAPQDIWPYLFVLVFIFLAASLLVAVQCLRIALENPVRRLSSE